jgi:hypothetical protein
MSKCAGKKYGEGNVWWTLGVSLKSSQRVPAPKSAQSRRGEPAASPNIHIVALGGMMEKRRKTKKRMDDGGFGGGTAGGLLLGRIVRDERMDDGG